MLFGITIVVYGILLAAPGRADREVRQQPADDRGAAASSSRRPGASTSRSRSSTAAGWASATRRSAARSWLAAAPAAFIGPTGWPNFLPTAISGADNGVLHGDFGYSISTGEPVIEDDRAGGPADVHPGRDRARHLADVRHRPRRDAAVKRYSLFDQAATVFGYVGFAMPTFWLGIMLIFVFSGPGLNMAARPAA